MEGKIPSAKTLVDKEHCRRIVFLVRIGQRNEGSLGIQYAFRKKVG